MPAYAEGYDAYEYIFQIPACAILIPFFFLKIRKSIREKKAARLILEHPYYGWLGILLKKSMRYSAGCAFAQYRRASMEKPG